MILSRPSKLKDNVTQLSIANGVALEAIDDVKLDCSGDIDHMSKCGALLILRGLFCLRIGDVNMVEKKAFDSLDRDYGADCGAWR